jgi:hypothetical protein
MFVKLLKNQCGQAAIFIALIFQVLFIFFAMIVNVGMLVHYKINLQNSVDLAAYYAAMKQAENLNAIAHVNYQIRQSWKLLSWRYRIVGSSGLREHPAGPLELPTGESYKYNDPTGDNDEPVPPPPGALPRDFCVQFYPTFQNGPVSQSTCWDYDLSFVGRLPIPQVLFGFAPINEVLQNNAKNFRFMADASVSFQGIGNLWVLAQFIYGWRADSKNRRDVIRMISNEMSVSTDDFKDLDGESVLTGAEKTLKNNLAEGHTLNSVKLFNPLAGDRCGITNPNETPKWLVPIETSPAYAYRDQDIDNEEYHYRLKYLPANDINAVLPAGLSEYPEYKKPLFEVLQYVLGKVITPQVDFRDIIGFEKNPWCMAYVGISASTTAKLPFMPFGGGFTMTARAYVKPFGGRIGPWYENTWAQSADRSSGGVKTDNLLPPREAADGTIADPGDQSRLPNFSRYVGDVAGMISKVVQRYYVRPLFVGSFNWNVWINSGSHVGFADLNPEGDIIAYSQKPEEEGSELMRKLEIGGIAPDLFDITYYSIEPNFGEHYLLRLQKRAANSANPFRVRGDLGWRENDDKFKTFSIKDQIDVFNGVGDPAPVYNSEKLFFTITNKAQSLTSWTEASLMDYSFSKSEDRFGVCQQAGRTPADTKAPTTAGDCVRGGRTGFSVKFVSERFLNDPTLILGGEGTSGPLLNPPPNNF